jgi:hypothetical protein
VRFGVVVHRTPTEDYDLENANAQAIEKITKDNDLHELGLRIEELAWLKNRDKVLGKFASLGIWFDTAEGANFLLDKGFLIGRRFIGSVERCELKRKRCFRCQRFGHFAWSCKETPRCGHCAGQHERERCPPGVRARCLDCGGEHPTSDRQMTFRHTLFRFCLSVLSAREMTDNPDHRYLERMDVLMKLSVSVIG